MKKLIIGAALIAAVMANADTVLIPERNADGVFVTNSYESVEYAQKCIKAKAEGKTPDAWTQASHFLCRDTTTPEKQAEIDAILSAKRFFTSNPRFATAYPKLFANFAKVYVGDVPELVPLTEEIVANPTSADIRVLGTVVASYSALFRHHLIADGTIKNLLNVAPVGIRHKIRKEGKSFVAKDGLNPVQNRIDRLSAALNAPRLAGLNDALKECGMDFGLDFEKNLMSADEVETLRKDVLNGDKNFIPHIGYVLRTHLGIDEYNKFVKLYNEGE